MQDEKMLKRFLKRRCKVTLAFVTAFLITGSLTMASEADPLFPKDKDTEVVFFLNGALGSGELESVRNIGEVKLPGYNDTIKPPIEWTPIEPSTPVEPDKPVEPKPEPNPDKPIEKPEIPLTPLEPAKPIKPNPDKPEIPLTPLEPAQPIKPSGNVNIENKVQENGIVFNIKENDNFTNKGNLTYKSDVEMLDKDEDGIYETFNKEAYVIKNNGGIVINEGTISIEGLKEVDMAGKGHIVKIGEGAGVYQQAGSFINKGTIQLAGNGYDVDNDGYMETVGGVGVLVEGGTAVNESLIKGNPSHIVEDVVVIPMGIGMQAKGGKIENAEKGIIENMFYGMSVEGNGTAINNGTIQSSIVGILAQNGGTAINNGTIHSEETATGQPVYGLYARDFSSQDIEGKFATVITNNEKGIVYGNVKAEGPNATIINKGKIFGDKVETAGGIIKNDGGTIESTTINVSNGKFVQGANGKLEAEKVNGDIYLAGNYAENNFNDKIAVNGNISIKEHNGEIKSDSIMYDYNSTDKTLERKEFSELLNNKNIASYLEDNYMDGDLIRQELYNNLKDINTVKEFNRATNNLFGNDIYPALNKQTLEMVRFNRDTLYSQVFNQDTDKDTRIIAGADYKNFDVDSSNLSGYDTDIQSVFIGMDKQMSANNRLGGIINVGKMKSSFEMNNAERDDMFVQANLYNIYQNNGYRLVNNLFVGATDGDLERDLKFGDVYGRQTADIDSTYIGLNNVLTRKFDFNSIYITPKLEANFTQLMNSEIKEDGNYGLEIEKQDVTSIEAGVGIEVGKEFMLTDTLKAGVKLSGTYLAELSDPYEEVNVRLRQINHSEFVKISEYDNEDYKDISLRLELSNDSISSYAEYKYMFDDSIGTLGVSYKF